MLLSRTHFLLVLLFASFGLSLQASSIDRFPDLVASPDTTTCPDDFLIDLGEDIRIIYGEEVGIYFSSNRPMDGDEQWMWSDPTHLSCLSCPTPTYSPTESTSLTLSIIDGDGCIASDELFVEVILKDDIFVPNAFSPNNDGVNDLLVVYTGSSIAQITRLRILNSNRDVVFEQYNFRGNANNIGWDGRYKGELQNPSVFAYVLEVELVDGSLQQLTGTIALVR
ncbi:gliding motility-associated C-terminal domain-containing protein [Lewinella cohaerens]|uniref:T9SS type B sorting domain-containing protein n=1 Tax=Lewinella cohaerens TaxID=70995 RepID=UPI0003688D56|nr:gliding motility-associated C-terminal domain-containing protein [Lewinella cohaerens]